MSAYYNEIDPFAAQWLRNLMDAGLIALGDIDERDIWDVTPDELAGYDQCHFFAGVGVWSYALRLAGWPDDKPVWTGSCPCQPFSAAGKRAGFADKRHLWPAWFHLIEQRRPGVVFGEQVAGKDGLAWLDLVRSDMEAAEYAVGAVDIPACGFGAPHKRNRLYFVGHAAEYGRKPWRPESRRPLCTDTAGPPRLVGNAESPDWQVPVCRRRQEPAGAESGGASLPCLMADNTSERRDGRQGATGANGCAGTQDRGLVGNADTARPQGRSLQSGQCSSQRPTRQRGPVNGFWAAAVFWTCADGKSRPIPARNNQLARRYGADDGARVQDRTYVLEPSLFPLAHGTPNRVGRLRAYGNAIVAPQAAEFIKAYMEARP